MQPYRETGLPIMTTCEFSDYLNQKKEFFTVVKSRTVLRSQNRKRIKNIKILTKNPEFKFYSVVCKLKAYLILSTRSWRKPATSTPLRMKRARCGDEIGYKKICKIFEPLSVNHVLLLGIQTQKNI